MEKFPSIVSNIMSSPVITVDGATNVRDAAILMNSRRMGSIIVTELGRAVGIVTERDVLKKVTVPCRDPCQTKVKEIMTSPLITIPQNLGILEAMRKMRDQDVRRLVVMKDDELLGIITDKDLLKAVSYSALTSFHTLLTRSR